MSICITAIEMDVDLETIVRKVVILEDKVSKLEKLQMHEIKQDAQRVKEAVSKYLESSIEFKDQWKGRLSAVDEVRAMRRHIRSY